MSGTRGRRAATRAPPTMLSDAELDYLYELGRAWDGRADLLEIGPWLGGSTVALAAGMSGSRVEQRGRLHVVDTFRWRPFMADRAPLRLADGDSFRPFFEENVAPFAGLLAVHEVRLPDEPFAAVEFGAGGNVADVQLPLFSAEGIGELRVVFVDGAKSWPALLHLLREIAAHVGPDTRLVLQDYRYWAAIWVPMMVAMLGDGLRFVEAPRYNTATFSPTGTFAVRLHVLPESLTSIAYADGLGLIEAGAMSIPVDREIVRLGAMLYAEIHGRRDEAVAAYRRAERSWPMASATDQLERARRWLEGRTGSRMPRSARASGSLTIVRGRRALGRRLSKLLRRQ